MTDTAFLQMANRAGGKLAAGIDDSAASLTLQAGEGALYPSTFPFRITSDAEILEVNARAGDVLSGMTRGEEGTSPAAHLAGANVRLHVTAGAMTQIHDAINALELHYGSGIAAFPEIATPANPAQNTLLLFSRASGDSIQLVARSSVGQEAILATLLDGAAPAAKKMLLLGVKQ